MKREIENTYFEHTLKFYSQNPEKNNNNKRLHE